MDLTTIIDRFYNFIVIGVTDYLFVFDVHFIIAFMVVIIGIKYTKNIEWYKNLFGKFREYCLPITGGVILSFYLIELYISGDINSDYIFSLLQSYMLTIVFQDIFSVLVGFLINKLTLGSVKFDHDNKSINYFKSSSSSSSVELNKGED